MTLDQEKQSEEAREALERIVRAGRPAIEALIVEDAKQLERVRHEMQWRLMMQAFLTGYNYRRSTEEEERRALEAAIAEERARKNVIPEGVEP